MAEMNFLRWAVEVLEGYDISLSGIILIILVGSIIVRGWYRERLLQEWQNALNERIDAELLRMTKVIEACEKSRAELMHANSRLGHWKAVCEDACPQSDQVHKLKLTRIPLEKEPWKN